MPFYSQERKPANSEGGMGLTVSTLYNPDYEKDCKIQDQDKTAFDWCKDGNILEMKKSLENDKTGTSVKDEQVSINGLFVGAVQ